MKAVLPIVSIVLLTAVPALTLAGDPMPPAETLEDAFVRLVDAS